MRNVVFFLLLCLLSSSKGLAQTEIVVSPNGESVRILRDNYGVPHVFASTPFGLSYGNGYAVAEDRLGQLELFRRAAKGEIAALIGPDGLEADKETRLDGYTDHEREIQFAGLSPELQMAVSAYAQGINAYIAHLKLAPQPLPLHVANYPVPLEPATLQPWKVTDTVAIFQMMGRRFGGAEGAEIQNLQILTYLKSKHGGDAYRLFNDLIWRNDADAPTTIPPGEGTKPTTRNPYWTDNNGNVLNAAASPKLPENINDTTLNRALDVLNQTARLRLARRYGLPLRWGSYCFVVGRERSVTGDALLVRGPQLDFMTPEVVHEIHLVGAGTNCIGIGIAGIPGILVGHNTHAAWSITVGMGASTDIFIETLDPNQPTRYRYKGEWREMEQYTETFAVAGQPVEHLPIYRTVHGPVVAWDREHNIAYSRCASYRNKELDSLEAFARFQGASNVKQFDEAASRISLSLNVFCSTQEGDIGYWFCGRAPIRAADIDPRLPTPGDGVHDWRGFIPWQKMPHSINPRQGFLVNWNTKPVQSWDNYDRPTWGKVFHSERIADLLAAKPKVGLDDLRRILIDIGVNDPTAEALLKQLKPVLARNKQKLSPKARTAAEILIAWDNHANEGSIAKTIMDAWREQTFLLLFQPVFGDIPALGQRYARSDNLLLHVLLGKRSQVPVCYNYLLGHSPTDLMLEALNRAVEKLVKEHGTNMVAWAYHQGRINFGSVGNIPDTDRGTYIQIIACTNPVLLGWNILPPGQSERLDSQHLGDQRELAGWFLFKPMLTELEDIEHAAAGQKH